MWNKTEDEHKSIFHYVFDNGDITEISLSFCQVTQLKQKIQR
jgi:hypothetical protein